MQRETLCFSKINHNIKRDYWQFMEILESAAYFYEPRNTRKTRKKNISLKSLIVGNRHCLFQRGI